MKYTVIDTCKYNIYKETNELPCSEEMICFFSSIYEVCGNHAKCRSHFVWKRNSFSGGTSSFSYPE